MILLSLLAALAVLISAASPWLAWPLATLAQLYGLLRAGWESRRARPRFFLPGGAGTPRVDGREVADLRLSRRGPLTVLAWRGRTGRWHHRCCCPDSLSRQTRRELTLAAEDWRVSPSRRSMAP
ncbi:MAG TPA: hypothetical protein VM469_02175 [Pseudoxanthomonas sp.]|jgi:hypothetical protein|nr:hypothetical protein [Pseudoxanthomonas sp.]